MPVEVHAQISLNFLKANVPDMNEDVPAVRGQVPPRNKEGRGRGEQRNKQEAILEVLSLSQDSHSRGIKPDYCNSPCPNQIGVKVRSGAADLILSKLDTQLSLSCLVQPHLVFHCAAPSRR